MGRPHKYRKLSGASPEFNFYHPFGLSEEEEKIMTMYLSAEEFEALFLRHYENMKQTDAANLMTISQTTYSRILARAYEKLTKAFVEGFAISFQTHPLQNECPHSPTHRKRFRRGNQHNLPPKNPDDPPQVVFQGYGCQKCGFEWAVDFEKNALLNKTKASPKKKNVCPECASDNTYRLIKKLTPEA